MLAIIFVLLSCHSFSALLAPEVTTFGQFYALSSEQAAQKLPIRIRGTVLCCDVGWGQLYVHDGRQTSWVDPRSFSTNLHKGQYIEITGDTLTANSFSGSSNLNVSILDERSLPAARRLELSELAKDFGQWIEITGLVRSAETSRGRLCLMVYESGISCQVFVLGRPGTNDTQAWVGSRIRARGVNSSRIVQGRLESGSVFVPGISDVTFLERASSDYRDRPVVPIDALFDRELGAWTNQPVHLNGMVTAYSPGEYIVIKDPTGLIRARVSQVDRIDLDTRGDLWGFLTVLPNEAILADACFQPATPLGSRGLALIAEPSLNQVDSSAGTVLSNISQVVGLERSVAARHIPVRLHGVVTYADADWKNGFLQDSDGAVFFDLTQPEVRPGQWVELTGHTDPGGYLPMISDASVQVLGTTNLPAPTRVDLDTLAGGRLDSHWVEMQGVVQRLSGEGNHRYLKLMSPKGALNVLIVLPAEPPSLGSLIDSLVRVRGVCCSQVNDRRQLTGFVLQVPGPDCLSIIEAAPVDPFSIQSTSVRAVARFDPAALPGRRVKLSGKVTLTLPGQGFFLQDESGGIRVYSAQTNEVHPGDLVQALGFPGIGDFAPRLEEAIFRQLGSGPLPPPRPVSAGEILAQGAYDSVRVQVEGRLLQKVVDSAHPRLVLQSGPIIFTARLVGSGGPVRLTQLRPGTLLRFNGVCSLQAGERHQAEAFRLLIGRPADIEFLKAPPLWTGRQVLTVGGLMGLIILAGLGWVLSLRGQVRLQTAAIQKEKNLLATLIDHLPDNVYVKDLQGRYVLTNLAHARFHGAPSPDHFRGKTGFQLFPRKRAEAYAEADQKIFSGKTPVFSCEEEVTNGEGESRCLATTKVPLKAQSGDIIGLVGFSRDVTEAKLAEHELHEKQRVLSTLMGNLPGLAYRCLNDPQWTMEFLSEGCLDLTGYAPTELLGNQKICYAQIIHPHDRQRVWQEVQNAIQKRERFQLLYRIVTRDGVEKWVWEQGMGVFSVDGRLEALEGFVADVTERRRADVAVRDSEARFRAIWEHSIDGMLLTDSEGTILAVNEAFCRLVRLPRERLISQPFPVAWRGESSDDSLVKYRDNFRSGRLAPRSTSRVLLSNDEQKDLEISSCFVELGQQGRAVLGIVRDVSERRRVESVLAYERDLLGTLLENLPDALYFKDLKSRFIRVSRSKLGSSWAMALARHRYEQARISPSPVRAASELPALPEAPPPHLASRESFAEYIVGKTDFDFFEEARARNAFEDEQEILRTGKPLIGKVEKTKHWDGHVTWSLTTKMPWRDKDGCLIGTFGVSKDITGIKEAEANLESVHRQLLEASRQAGMAEVATGVLHNVGNVLNSVNVSANLLAEKLHQSRVYGLAKAVALLREHASGLADFITQDPRGRQLPLYLEQLSQRLTEEQALLLGEVGCLARNVEHIKHIVAMQQTYAKPTGITESVQAVDLVEDALRINSGQLTRHHVEIVREYQNRLPRLTVDKHKVLQILINLVSNAGHACALAHNQDKRLTVRLGDRDHRIQFAIADNGVGIEHENLTRIFSLGFTTRSDGHGFGLHSGALAAKEMGGSLCSHSDGPNRGATFILELPLAPPT